MCFCDFLILLCFACILLVSSFVQWLWKLVTHAKKQCVRTTKKMGDLTAQDRALLFWFVCIPVRLAIGVLATILTYLNNTELFLIVGAYAGITCLGFLHQSLLTLLGWKTTGFLGGEVWWSGVRWIHTILWGLCSLLCFLQVRGAGICLIVDVCVGALAGFIRGK